MAPPRAPEVCRADWSVCVGGAIVNAEADPLGECRIPVPTVLPRAVASVSSEFVIAPRRPTRRHSRQVLLRPPPREVPAHPRRLQALSLSRTRSRQPSATAARGQRRLKPRLGELYREMAKRASGRQREGVRLRHPSAGRQLEPQRQTSSLAATGGDSRGGEGLMTATR